MSGFGGHRRCGRAKPGELYIQWQTGRSCWIMRTMGGQDGNGNAIPPEVVSKHRGWAEARHALTALQVAAERERVAGGSGRRVFPSGDIPRLWAYRIQDNARNQQGNLYFQGDTIYSYGGHFPIARHVERRGRRAVLFTTRSWSSTTSGHKWSVRAAIPDGVTVFEVPGVEVNTGRATVAEHKRNFEYFAGEIKRWIVDAARAKLRRQELLRSIHLMRELARDYAEFFGVMAPRLPKVPDLEAYGRELRHNSALVAAENRKLNRIARITNRLLWGG